MVVGLWVGSAEFFQEVEEMRWVDGEWALDG